MKLKKTKKDIIEAIKTKRTALKTEMFEIDAKVQAVAPPSFVDALSMSAKNKQMVIDRMKEKEKEKKELMAQTVDRKANATPKTDAMKKMKLVEDFVNESFKGKSTLKENVLSVLTSSRADLTKLIKNARENEVKYTISRLAEGYQFNYQFELLKEDLAYSQIFDINNWAQEKIDELGIEACVDNMQIIDEFEKEAKKAGYKGQDLKDAVMAVQVYIQNEYEHSLDKGKKPVKEEVADTQVLKIIKKHVKLLDEVELDEPSVDWLSDEFEDEAYAGGFWDASMSIANEIIGIEDLDMNKHFEELTETIYNIIKHGKPFAVKSTPKGKKMESASEEHHQDEANYQKYWTKGRDAHFFYADDYLDAWKSADLWHRDIYYWPYNEQIIVGQVNPVKWYKTKGDEVEWGPIFGPFNSPEEFDNWYVGFWNWWHALSDDNKVIYHNIPTMDNQWPLWNTDYIEMFRKYAAIKSESEESKQEKHEMKEEAKSMTYYIKFWENDDDREQGISDIFSKKYKDLNKAIRQAQNLVDNNEYASVEVFESETDKVVYGYDGIYFWKNNKGTKEKIMKEEASASLGKKTGVITVAQYKDFLNDALEVVADADDTEKVRLSPNTYNLDLPYIGTYGGYISINSPISEDQSEDEEEDLDEAKKPEEKFEKAEKTFVDLMKQVEADGETPDSEIVSATTSLLRSLVSSKKMSQEEYNHVTKNWDEILKRHGMMEAKKPIKEDVDLEIQKIEKEMKEIKDKIIKLNQEFSKTGNSEIKRQGDILRKQWDDLDLKKFSLKDSKKSLKESALNKSKFKDIIGKYFEYSGDFDFLDIVAHTLDRIDFEGDEELRDGGEHAEEILSQAIDDTFTYIHDQWIIAQHYSSSPEDLTWEEVVQEFRDDMYEIFKLVNDSVK